MGEALTTVALVARYLFQLQSPSEHRPRRNFCFKALLLCYVYWPAYAPDVSLLSERVL